MNVKTGACAKRRRIEKEGKLKKEKLLRNWAEAQCRCILLCLPRIEVLIHSFLVIQLSLYTLFVLGGLLAACLSPTFPTH